MDFKGKTAVVTGSSGGIGAAVAIALAKEGADVVLASRNVANMEKVKQQIEAVGRKALVIACDVSKDESVTAMAKQAIDTFGKIDILVNNAGIIKRVPILDMAVADFRQVIDIDLVAPFIVAKRVVPSMISRGGGKIINMCSMMSIYGRNSVSAYASAKGGLKLLTANMCCEWAKHNIQANGIGPGYIATSQTDAIRVNGHPFNNLVMTRTPAGRWGDPEDLAGAAVFLASAASNYVNGHLLFVDGGILANFGYVAGENEMKY